MSRHDESQTESNTRSIDAEKAKLKMTMRTLAGLLATVAAGVWAVAALVHGISTRLDSLDSKMEWMKKQSWTVTAQKEWAGQLLWQNNALKVPEVKAPDDRQ